MNELEILDNLINSLDESEEPGTDVAADRLRLAKPVILETYVGLVAAFPDWSDYEKTQTAILTGVALVS